MIFSIIEHFSRSQECLRKSTCRIALKTVFGKRSDQQSIKDGMGIGLGNRSDAVKQYKKY